MAGWREALEGLDHEHRLMLEGGSLSQLFLRYPLTICHPIFVGMVYGILASLTLIVPFAYAGWQDSTSWDNMAIDWGTISLIFCAMTASLGGFSLLISGMFKRPPIRLENRRRYIFPIPFIGLLLLTWAMIGDAPEFVSSLGWFFAILPGPLYIHLSYAPRWRMLDRIDRGLDPFDGMKRTIDPEISRESDELDDDDLDEVVAEA
ncbi:MAG: hypothetical protein VYB30_01485 [Candidatus Thermoplasmatota archaeon]|nr:hypothetical protein [Candidatus Thermoplasmatota archaeon]